MAAATWRSAGAALLDLLYPRICPACGAPPDDDAGSLCEPCARRLALLVNDEYCAVCGSIVGPHLLLDSRCAECRGRRPPVERIVRTGVHRDVLRDLVIRLKHRPDVDALLGGMLADACRVRMADAEVDVLVPIPTPWRRAWQRRFHPAYLLATELGRRWRKPVRRWLRMRRHVRRQTGLSGPEREKNIKGAFALRWTACPAGRTLCLVDDVTTTGATLREAARVLREAGAGRVVAAVISKATLEESRTDI